MEKLECKYGFSTCSNLIKDLNIPVFCETCDDGQNYQHKDNFKPKKVNKKKRLSIKTTPLKNTI